MRALLQVSSIFTKALAGGATTPAAVLLCLLAEAAARQCTFKDSMVSNDTTVTEYNDETRHLCK